MHRARIEIVEAALQKPQWQRQRSHRALLWISSKSWLELTWLSFNSFTLNICAGCREPRPGVYPHLYYPPKSRQARFIIFVISRGGPCLLLCWCGCFEENVCALMSLCIQNTYRISQERMHHAERETQIDVLFLMASHVCSWWVRSKAKNGTDRIYTRTQTKRRLSSSCNCP